MSTSEHFDVIIIGSGAGGGSLAYRLAPSGKRVLILERGEFLPREKENWDPRENFIKRRYSSETWYDRRDKPFHPEHYYCVGGNTKMYGAVLARFRREDFGELDHFGGAVSPGWPIAYDDLEPYYTQAEQLYQVRGERDGDPTEPYASGPYPFPPVSHEPEMQEMADGLSQAGYHPSHLPIGIQLNEQHPHFSKCIRCDTCGGHPCLVHAKCDAEVMAVRPAIEYPNVELLTGARVTRLKTNRSGRTVTQVLVERNGQLEEYRGDIVVVAAGACNTSRLLLASACDQHPRGLANGSDQVGRNFMLHHRSVLVAFSARKNTTRYQMTLGLNDFYFGSDEFPFPMGRIQSLGMMKGAMFQGRGPVAAPLGVLDRLADRSIAFLITGEDLPDPRNRVTLAGDDALKVSYEPNNLAGMRRLESKFKSLLTEITRRRGVLSRGIHVVQPVGLEGMGHQSGTCRFGTDPATSVLDVNCRAHEMENLYVVDASFFPSVGAMNPTLTIIANALRVGDRILQRLGAQTKSHLRHSQ